MIEPDVWRKDGREIETADGKIFVCDIGTPNGEPILVLHGFPTSSWDFAEAATLLGARRRLVLFDFLGFGLSDKPHDAGYSLFEQADVATLVARSCKLERVHIWAHDMGTSVATELLARRERGLLPFSVRSLVLMNGSVYIEMASPTIGQRLLKSAAGPAFARLSRKSIFVAQIRRVFAKPPPEEMLDRMWSLVARCDGTKRLPQVISYMEERARFRRRWIGALERLDVPTLVAWGAKDPVAKLAIGERLARETPGADMMSWDDLGHYPQVEDPARIAAAVEAFVERVEKNG